MRNERNRAMRRFGLVTLAFILVLSADLRAEAEDTGWSIGLGFASGDAVPENGQEIEIDGIGLFGRWQHESTGWGAMAEIRAGEDDERFTEFDYGQLNLYATYTWRRKKPARPFVKFGISNTDVELAGGASDDDTARALGAGVEVGRGRRAFHFSIDDTEATVDVIDPRDKTLFGTYTVGAVFRF